MGLPVCATAVTPNRTQAIVMHIIVHLYVYLWNKYCEFFHNQHSGKQEVNSAQNL